MTNKINAIITIALFYWTAAFPQTGDSKIFFDKLGKSTTEAQAYYYRQQGNNDEYKAYYMNGATYFEGKISKASDTDEGQNVYSGTCTWYYKNGKKKAVRNFDATGTENGVSTHYYESGKIWKEIEYANGQIANNKLKEYDEEGQVSRIFEEDFNNNINDWDLYTSDKSSASMVNGSLELTSASAEGTSRFISLQSQGSDFALEVVINIEKLKAGGKAGLLYGFKDWQNYNYYLITSSSFYIGTVYEGVSAVKAEGMFSGAIKDKSLNVIKIIGLGDKNVYSINGEVQYTTDRTRNFGNNIGFAVSGKSSITVEKLINKEIDFKSSGITTSAADANVKATGSGVVFTSNGYILTNYHVVEDANKIMVELNSGGTSKTYTAELIQKDADNDLAILKINDESFKALGQLKYSFKEGGTVDVGTTVFTIGFPLALSGMGKEAKFTDGKVSSKTGYNGAINTYQTSIPVQPGNSGSPLFNDKGQLIGIINAKITGADNVSYAIKLSYVMNLVELLTDTPQLPRNQALNTASIEEKVKVLSDYVVLIKIK